VILGVLTLNPFFQCKLSSGSHQVEEMCSKIVKAGLSFYQAQPHIATAWSKITTRPTNDSSSFHHLIAIDVRLVITVDPCICCSLQKFIQPFDSQIEQKIDRRYSFRVRINIHHNAFIKNKFAHCKSLSPMIVNSFSDTSIDWCLNTEMTLFVCDFIAFTACLKNKTWTRIKRH